MILEAILVVLAVGVVALATLSAWRATALQSDVGPARLARDDDPGVAEREVRDVVRARNARRAQRGLPSLDEDAEVARLLSSATPAAELRDEARVLVQRENDRRARAGLPPLDVEHEIDRRLSGLRA